MNKGTKMEDVTKRLDLPDGNQIVLLDTLAKKQGLGPVECARNILLLGPDGHTIWQVSSDFDSDGDPFTNVIYENGELRAYRWDGGMYKIDMRSGRASPNVLAR
jgi:hypothetical protein